LRILQTAMGSSISSPRSPYYDRKEFEDAIQELRNQEEYTKSSRKKVYEVLVSSFIHPKDSSNPSSISSGLLTGPQRVWAFTVENGLGGEDLYYYVYDTRLIDHRPDKTWVVEHTGLTLVKAQVGLKGYIPDLQKMLSEAPKFVGGYTRLTSAMIRRACIVPIFWSDLINIAEIMLKYVGCLHALKPDARYAMNLVGRLLDVICEHRLVPPISSTFKGEKIVSSHWHSNA
jgi:hypothetical protein